MMLHINRFAHALETGMLYQWLKFIFSIIGLYLGWQILIGFDNLPIIARILLAHVPYLTFYLLIDRLPVFISKVFGAHKLLAVANESNLTLYLEENIEIPIKGLKSVDLGSNSFLKRWQWPFLKNTLTAHYDDRNLVFLTKVDYQPLYQFLKDMNGRLASSSTSVQDFQSHI